MKQAITAQMHDDIVSASRFSGTVIYLQFIVLSCLLTTGLYWVQARVVLAIPLSAVDFIIPIVAGIVFGYLLGRIQVLSRQLGILATTDGLTQIYNRAQFDYRLTAEVDRAQRYGSQLATILFDVDHFKQVNDTYGHQVGDYVLITLAKLVKSHNRSSDTFARYGGEEFIILVVYADASGAAQDAERLRKAIAEFKFKHVGTITCSFGVAEFGKKDDSADNLVRRADEALYRAKQSGRNRVEIGWK